MNLHMSYGTMIKEERRTMTFQIDGDGAFQRIN
jgi:hypothetical protein